MARMEIRYKVERRWGGGRGKEKRGRSGRINKGWERRNGIDEKKRN